ncbi:unnamed protein product [Larinioides sclopetarius]|uniref:SOCS box domain-containing protein n=1 Tax=Larinioides sclopetarius TaxID=280406 RepID=A0AAV2BNE6_9ARAC
MYITIVPTLKCMVLSKIVQSFYYDPEIRALEKRLRQPLCFLPPKDWVPIVNQRLSEIFPSRTLRKSVVNLFMPISLEVVMWGYDHREVNNGFFSCMDMWNCFRWNSLGIIDREQTVKLIIAKRNIRMTDRFCLACNYELKEDILEMWKNMPEDDMERVAGMVHSPIIDRWVHCLQEGGVPETRELVDAFLGARPIISECSRSAALRVLFPELSKEDRFRCLTCSIRHRETHPDDLRYCLSQLDSSQQTEVYRRHTFWVLKSFLHWPVQSAFLDLMDQMWSFLTVLDFGDLLHVILCQIIMKGWEDFDYVYILQNVWRQSPDDFKDSIKKAPIYEPLRSVIHYGGLEPFSLDLLSNYECNCHLNNKIIYIE